METGNTTGPIGPLTTLGRKSWTAYVGLSLLAILLLFVAVPAAWLAHFGAGLAVLVVSLVGLGYRFAVIRSTHLYYDDAGVWLASGVLPWARGVVGVKWRDLDEAVFMQGLWSWMFKSYTIRIGHRFTKSSEIVLSHMARGHDVVMTINRVHADKARTGDLG